MKKKEKSLKRYLITSPEFYTDAQVLKHRADYALYRDKTNPDYDKSAKHFVELCESQENLKSFIHQKVDLAKELKATGVHLTSQQFDEIVHAKKLNLEVIISTHTHEEVLKAQVLGADAVTYSPIFASPNKGTPKGIEDLKELLSKCDINVFALGGIIDEEQVQLIEKVKPYGFASIRYFC